MICHPYIFAMTLLCFILRVTKGVKNRCIHKITSASADANSSFKMLSYANLNIILSKPTKMILKPNTQTCTAHRKSKRSLRSSCLEWRARALTKSNRDRMGS